MIRTKRTTVNINEDLMEHAAALDPAAANRTDLLNRALESHIARKASELLTQSGGSAPGAIAPRRR